MTITMILMLQEASVPSQIQRQTQPFELNPRLARRNEFIVRGGMTKQKLLVVEVLG